MGKGMKAGKKKSRENTGPLNEQYMRGYSAGTYGAIDNAYSIIFSLVLASLVNEFDFGADEVARLEDNMDELSIKLEGGDLRVSDLKRDLIEKGIVFKNFIEEDKIMANKAKYTEAALIKGIEDGLDNNEIMDRLNVARGSRPTINARLNKLRIKHGALEINTKQPAETPKEFDLKLYDTLTRYGTWYRVTAIGPDSFDIAETENVKNKETVTMADYISGKTAFIKRKLPEVKTYIDESLKEKPAAVNGAAVNKMTKDKIVSQLENLKENSQDFARAKDEPDSIWHDDIKALDVAIDAIKDSDMDPAYKFDGTVNASCEAFTAFQRQAELSFKADMNMYSNNVSKIKDKMEHGEIIDLVDVTEYNRIADKYRGVM